MPNNDTKKFPFIKSDFVILIVQIKVITISSNGGTKKNVLKINAPVLIVKMKTQIRILKTIFPYSVNPIIQAKNEN